MAYACICHFFVVSLQPILFLIIMANTRQEIIDELKSLLEQDVTEIKEQVDRLKTQFYTIESDELEEEFKTLLSEFKSKRAEIAAAEAKKQAENLSRKQAILEEMKTMVEGASAEGVMANLQRMRELQTEWKSIGAVPATKNQEIRKAYQQYQEQFYDLVKINIELRDLDFKKNLELKTMLCEAAEKLQENDNIVEASRALQQLHDEWAEIGPVARELREELWERFKAASSVINKKHQAYFDQLHAKEQENLEAKQAIIDQLKAINEPIVNGEPFNAKRWEEETAKVQELQNAWRKIGFAPKKHNQSIYEAYRAECDRFFNAKTEYFKDIRDTFNTNLKHKREIVASVEDIVGAMELTHDGTEMVEWSKEQWNEASQKIIALQAEWKTVGAVARKYSDELWKRFSDGCDAFFNKMREASAKARKESAKRNQEILTKNAAKQGAEGLRRMRDRLQQEIKIAENNILFFTAKSKGANKLVDDMKKKIDELKKQLDDVKEQLKQLDD